MKATAELYKEMIDTVTKDLVKKDDQEALEYINTMIVLYLRRGNRENE